MTQPREITMNLMVRLAAIACLALFFTAGSAVGKESETHWLRSRITLDASGKLGSVEWLDIKPNVITNALENEVRKWEFVPAMVDGVAVPTRTGLLLQVNVSRLSNGLALSIGTARTGAVSDRQTPPRYPSGQAKRGVEGQVLMDIRTDEAGKATSIVMADFQSTSKSASARGDFEAAALAAAKTWTFHTEQVGGKNQSAYMRVPVSFCMSNKCMRQFAKQLDTGSESRRAEDTEDMPEGMAVALDSAVKIKTRTSQVEI